jgi:alkylation response protein AidB-like acyl-CoA dehydrogenase
LGSCSQIAGSENPSLRERYLRDMAAGRHYVGVGFGHLRRPEPMLRAEPVSDRGGGWILNGVAPWVTGWPFLSGVIYGATLPDNRHLYVYIAAEESDTQISSPPLPLCAMNGSATTEVRLNQRFVPETDFVRYSTREAMAKGDEGGIAGAVHPPLGCARGSLNSCVS